MRTASAWVADIKLRGLSKVFPLSRKFPSEEGIFVRVNPVKGGSKGDSNADVACYRNILVEADTGSKEEQWAASQKITLRLGSAAFNSGDRSVNDVFTIDAPDAKTYTERWNIVAEFCRQSLGFELDLQNKNPSRYTRLAGAARTGAKRD